MRFIVGYNGSTKSEAELRSWDQFQHLDPEYQERVIWLCKASTLEGKPVGFGGIWRSDATQLAGALSRHVEVPSGGCCVYGGKHYAKKPNVAHMIFPPWSYHGDTTPTTPPHCLAADMVGNLVWLTGNAHRVKMHTFWNVNNEPWHLQCDEYPNGKKAYNPRRHHPVPHLVLPPLPGDPSGPLPVPSVDAPLPSMQVGKANNVTEVRELQVMLNFLKITDDRGRPIFVDGSYGNQTAGAVMKLQRDYLGFTDKYVDGKYGPQTYARFQTYLTNLAPFTKAA